MRPKVRIDKERKKSNQKKERKTRIHNHLNQLIKQSNSSRCRIGPRSEAIAAYFKFICVSIPSERHNWKIPDVICIPWKELPISELRRCWPMICHMSCALGKECLGSLD